MMGMYKNTYPCYSATTYRLRCRLGWILTIDLCMSEFRNCNTAHAPMHMYYYHLQSAFIHCHSVHVYVCPSAA